ncbi:hypothetical protein L596_020873 [Steinernema carpocapsae]|uniref:Mo25-like protein n=1 Tax=Steinernema carpocapsae TaxID=34508 RepID=A0A4V6A143_STECR|nr:hypothetical protein L596_020873 [Steinernema carpocapsae]
MHILSLIFPKNHHSPGCIAKTLRDELALLASSTDNRKMCKVNAEIGRLLESTITILLGSGDNDRFFDKSNPVIKLSNEFAYAEIVPLLIGHLKLLSFESKKKVALIFINLMKRKIGFKSPTAEIMRVNKNLVADLIYGYDHPDIAQVCGIMLRECARHEQLAKTILEMNEFYHLMSFMEHPSFEIAGDAYNTFKTFILSNKTMTASFLYTNYKQFFENFDYLVSSDNYLTRRQAFEILRTLLKEPENQKVADKFLKDPKHLRRVMWALRDNSSVIQLEAFDIFLYFLDHPKRPRTIQRILEKNREKLLQFMDQFLVVKKNDPESAVIKEEVLKKISAIGVN